MDFIGIYIIIGLGFTYLIVNRICEHYQEIKRINTIFELSNTIKAENVKSYKIESREDIDHIAADLTKELKDKLEE